MENPAESGAAPGLLEDLKAIWPGLAAVDNNRKLGRARAFELAAKDGGLDVSIAKIVLTPAACARPSMASRSASKSATSIWA